MKKVTHPYYKDYPVQPYINPERDLDMWENFPERFPYGKIAKVDITPVEEGLVPGDIVLLWRIGFNNVTTETWMPDYFEYRYGINTDDSIKLLTEKGYIYLGSALETLDLLNAEVLKRMLKSKGLPVSGKKQDILERVVINLSPEELEASFPQRKHAITPQGRSILEKYPNIIKKHGPKMM